MRGTGQIEDSNNATVTALESLVVDAQEWLGGDDAVETSTAAVVPVIAFRMGRNWFALRAAEVKEIVVHEEMTRVPSLPSYFFGVALVHGRLVPVVDFVSLFGQPHEPIPAQTASRLLVAEVGQHLVGIIADEARGVLEVEPHAAEVPNAMAPEEYKLEDHVVPVVNVEMVVKTLVGS